MNWASEYVWSKFGKPEVDNFKGKFRLGNHAEDDLFLAFFGPESPAAKVFCTDLGCTYDEFRCFYATLMCCAGWGKSISFVDEHGVQGEGAMGKDEFNAMLSKIGQHRQNEDSKVGSRYFWYVLMNDLNRFWCAQFALGGEHHSLIAVDDDKMKANMKAGWKAGLKLHVLPDKSKKNSRGFVLITGALVCTGLPLVVEAEQQNATTHQTYRQVLSRLSNNRTVGDPDLSRIVLASDRYFSNWTIVEGAVKCGAHWLGTVKRSRTTPFTFGSHVYDGQRDVEQHGPSTIYTRQYPMAVNKDLRLKAMAERTGVKSGAVSMLWTTLQELPPLAFDYRVGSVDLAMWKRALPNGVIYHRVGSDRVDAVRYFFPMPLDEGHPQERGDRFTQFPHLVAALPVVHLCLEQRHAGWFILRQFRLTSTTVQLLFHEYRGAREYADFERVFSLFYRDGAVDRPTVPRDRQDGSAVDGKLDAASIPQVIGKVEEEEEEEPEGVVAGMDVVNESAEAGQDELPTSESFDLTDDAQVQLLTTEEGRKKLTKEQLSSLNRQLGLEERRPGDLPKLYKDWALAPKERRPYVVLSREELKKRQPAGSSKSGTKNELIERLLKADKAGGDATRRSGLRRVLQASFLRRLTGDARHHAMLGHENEPKLLVRAAKLSMDTDGVPFMISEILTAGLIEHEGAPGVATSVDGVAVLTWKGNGNMLTTLCACEVKTRTTQRTVSAEYGTRILRGGKVFASVSASRASFREAVPHVSERIQLMHHAAVLGLTHSLLIVGDEHEIISMVLVEFEDDAVASYMSLCKQWVRDFLPFAHPSSDGSLTTLTPSDLEPLVKELKMLPDVHTVLNRLETWKSVNSMVPLPRASQFVPLMASVWDVAKGGSDSLSQLLSGVNFHLHTAHPATAVVRRLLMIHAAAYHRFLGMSRALAKTKKVDSLIQFRTAVNRQGPFATTLLRVSDQLLRLNSSGSAEVSRLRAVRETRATGTLYYLRGVPDMRRHADESTHDYTRRMMRAWSLTQACVGFLMPKLNSQARCGICSLRGERVVYCAGCEVHYCFGKSHVWDTSVKPSSNIMKARRLDEDGSLAVPDQRGGMISVRHWPETLTVVRSTRDGERRVTCTWSCWSMAHIGAWRLLGRFVEPDPPNASA